MKIKDGFLKAELAGIPCVLPYGQRLADLARTAILNDTGSFLYDAICAGADFDALLSMLQERYEAADEELPQLKEDLTLYLKQLLADGLAEEDAAPCTASPKDHSVQKAVLPRDSSPHPAWSHETPFYFRIGPLTFLLRAPAGFAEQFFLKFSCAPCEADQQITLLCGRPLSRTNGAILLRTDELILCDAGESYLFLFSKDWTVSEMHVKKDGSSASLYCDPAFMTQDMDSVFHAIRFAFLLLAHNRGLYVLHSASILYRGRAWLFSGSSGTGKSTHTRLWEESYQTPVLNGDLNLIGIHEGMPMAYGLPWCGTSGICTSQNYPLGGIVFLKQAAVCRVLTPTPDARILYLLQRLISPAWTKEQLLSNLAFAEQLSGKLPVFSLLCTKEPAAAAVMKEAIDNI